MLQCLFVHLAKFLESTKILFSLEGGVPYHHITQKSADHHLHSPRQDDSLLREQGISTLGLDSRNSNYKATMPDAGENYCGYFVKLIGLGVAVGGVICSWLTIGSCQFISFVDTDGNPPEDAEDPPFNNALEADVGIFKYRINKYFTDPDGGGTDCRDYDDKFTQQTAYPSLATAQFCTMMAPILAGVGMLITLLDICACRFSACYIVSTLFFLCAAGLQAGAFTLVADPAFW